MRPSAQKVNNLYKSILDALCHWRATNHEIRVQNTRTLEDRAGIAIVLTEVESVTRQTPALQNASANRRFQCLKTLNGSFKNCYPCWKYNAILAWKAFWNWLGQVRMYVRSGQATLEMLSSWHERLLSFLTLAVNTLIGTNESKNHENTCKPIMKDRPESKFPTNDYRNSTKHQPLSISRVH